MNNEPKSSLSVVLPVRPIQQSGTVKTLTGLITVGVGLFFSNLVPLSNCAKEFKQFDLAAAIDGVAPIAIVVGGLFGIKKRVDVGDLFTPDGMPGPNKPEGF